MSNVRVRVLCTLVLCAQGVTGFEYTYYEDLTPKDVVSILDTIKKGGKPKVRGVAGKGCCEMSDLGPTTAGSMRGLDVRPIIT
jgi:hypothetical protein